jgi:predicted HTH domain antitoxin
LASAKIIEIQPRSRAMSVIKLDVPDETLLALKGSEEAAGAEVRFAAAVKLYEVGRLSSGAAATLAGMPRTLFLARLGELDVPSFDLTREELERDFDLA